VDQHASTYVGRFAPSPTGPLHLGSLIAALASFLDARAARGRWLLRIEDLDPPREVPGAAKSILRSLQRHGLVWDGDVTWQSSRSAAYQRALQMLADRSLTYPCACSRARLAGLSGRYDGHCRQRPPPAGVAAATRVVTTPKTIAFNDAIQGAQRQCIGEAVGDFIVQRKDHLCAYQLAVVVDDGDSGVTHVVRGADLLECTPRQIYLQELLDLPAVRYAHVPVLANAQGQKLSKQNLAPALDDEQPVRNLLFALRFLGHPMPPEQYRQPSTLLAWAVNHWQPGRVPKTTQLQATHSP
jgi:glutamyl-Q tRNA(Asp) synthetase